MVELPLVVIVGRENVGKSTLFNRLVRERVAVEAPTPGITRDSNERIVEINGYHFRLFDTGGFFYQRVAHLEDKVKQKTREMIDKGDLILFMTDVRDGVTPWDEELARYLKERDKPTILLVNKVDSDAWERGVPEFYKLGFDEVLPISALRGYNIRRLKELLVEKLPKRKAEHWAEAIKIAIFGRPNVGKSTYVNTLLKEERMIVDEIPGTTIDACDIYWEYKGRPIIFVDTPGVRRKSRIKESIEFYSVRRAMRTIERADIIFVMVDASSHLTHQDKRIIDIVCDKLKSVLILANKVDLYKGKVEAGRLRGEFAFIPIIPVSALRGDNIYLPIDKAFAVYEEWKKFVPHGELKRKVVPHVRNFGIRDIQQVSRGPQVFVVYTEKKLRKSHLRAVENRIREVWGFDGVPILIKQQRVKPQKTKHQEARQVQKAEQAKRYKQAKRSE